MMIRISAKQVGHALCGLLVLAAAAVRSQTADAPAAGNARAFYLVPSVGVQTTLTNNVALSTTNRQSDLIAQITPAVQLGVQSGRVKGFLDYALTGYAYAKGDEASNLQNFLNARVNVEAIENWLFLDANASITQQYISPFGTQSSDPSLANSNRTEVSAFNVSPYIRGQIAGEVDYQARLSYAYTDSGSSTVSNTSTFDANLHFESTTRWSRLSWAVDLNHVQNDFSLGRNTTDDLVTARLTYAVIPEFSVSARANTESGNITTLEKQNYSGWGWGLKWNPSPRTHLFLEEDQRSFGSTHAYGFDYRTPRTVWRVSSVQKLSTGQYNSGRGNPMSAFDLLFAQFATVEPDPVLRAQFVNNFLQNNGINPNTSVNSNSLPNEIQEERRQEFSASLLGIRSTVIFNAYQTYSRNLGPLSNPGNNYANGNLTRWRGFGVNWSQRLTPQSTLSLNASQQRTLGPQSVQETSLWAVYAMWTTQLSPRAQGSISVRRQTFSSSTSPYNEAALIANLSSQF